MCPWSSVEGGQQYRKLKGEKWSSILLTFGKLVPAIAISYWYQRKENLLSTPERRCTWSANRTWICEQHSSHVTFSRWFTSTFFFCHIDIGSRLKNKVCRALHFIPSMRSCCVLLDPLRLSTFLLSILSLIFLFILVIIFIFHGGVRHYGREQSSHKIRAPCRRRIGGVVLRAESFDDLITADHKVLSEGCESRNNHRYAVVVQDVATQLIQSYPCKTTNFSGNTKELAKVLGAR